MPRDSKERNTHGIAVTAAPKVKWIKRVETDGLAEGGCSEIDIRYRRLIGNVNKKTSLPFASRREGEFYADQS